MSLILLKTLVPLLPAFAIFAGAAILLRRARTLSSFLQLIGAIGLLIVVGAHECEAFRLMPAMGWGQEHSIGHYLDLAGAIVAVAAFPIGYLWESARPASMPKL